jgi:hypothetical protein
MMKLLSIGALASCASARTVELGSYVNGWASHGR